MTDGDTPTPDPTPGENEQQLFPPPWPTARPSEPPVAPPTAPLPPIPPGPPVPPVTYHGAPEPHTPAPKSRRLALMAVVGVVALVAGAAGATIGVAVTDRTSTAPSTSSFLPPGASSNGNGNGSSNGGLGGFGSSDSGSGSGSSGSNADIDVSGIASKVNPAIVNIATQLTGGQEAAGSGMVLTSSGEVLTNNHVINGATKIQVEVGITGKTYTAKVLGYDAQDDVALIKLNNASGMKTITAAAASSVSRSDAVVAIGNALGRFGTPAAVGGSVTALHQKVTAGDGVDSETLSDMIRIAASIQPGDSGGALVDKTGKVIGMNTAADSGSGRFGYQSGTTGFAIPIGNALKVVEEIKGGDTSNGAHIGDRALLGVVLQDSSSGSGEVPFGNGDGSDVAGAPVTDVGSNTPAESAGIGSGDTITAVDQHTIRSTDDLRQVLDRYHPGDKVNIVWTDANGQSHHASVTLAKGPPA